ncbi:protein phosphatase 1F [Capsaspora owczarzaki ATCC 30864]|uniref:Protein phosphatase 1F n=1 Tax=Capsaspora owczarzaki (strain ATCC 30864) TaxID=595528 RepID=A0A0D2UQA6_CAPO3|nr:protein phosphatase 1F [Capsaspora owczarzaki ATCC 30864]KJE97181.1 protein phosphatase 1F [Capsaspora owczarzaki ATCC 30864]|eukprot:XP_004343503.2 protein phosphatase 1F [Capsaspora owczarzaki ATCC 30864]
MSSAAPYSGGSGSGSAGGGNLDARQQQQQQQQQHQARRRRSNDLRGDMLTKHKEFLKKMTMGDTGLPASIPVADAISAAELEAEALYIAAEVSTLSGVLPDAYNDTLNSHRAGSSSSSSSSSSSASSSSSSRDSRKHQSMYTPPVASIEQVAVDRPAGRSSSMIGAVGPAFNSLPAGFRPSSSFPGSSAPFSRSNSNSTSLETFGNSPLPGTPEVGESPRASFTSISSVQLEPSHWIVNASTFPSLSRLVVDQLEQADLSQFKLEDSKNDNMLDGRAIARWVVDSIENALKASEPSSRRGSIPLPPFKFDTHSFAAQGKRSTMEDRHVVIEDLNTLMGLDTHPMQAYFAVYDGHGGVDAAAYAKNHVHVQIVRDAAFAAKPEDAVKSGFERTDALFLERANRENWSSGATCVGALVRGTDLYVGWLGDSQAVLARNGAGILLTKPHKPNDEAEKARIEESGGMVLFYGGWRVNGTLAVARAIGDKQLKEHVIGTPDVVHEVLQPGRDEFLILACDGLWDVMDANGAVHFVSEYRARTGFGDGVAEALVEKALQLGSTDNVSIVVVFFDTPTQRAASLSSLNKEPARHAQVTQAMNM